MNGILAQTIAMVSNGNEFLQNGQLTDFYRQHSTFEHCHAVDFREMKKPFLFGEKKEVIVAQNPTEWFMLLKKNNCRKLRLFFQSQQADDHKLAAFVGGGGSWFIETVFDRHSDLWIANWRHDQNATTKPWQVLYGKAASKRPIANKQFVVDEIRDQLSAVLESIAEFAFEADEKHWASIFEKAKNTLTDAHPENGFYHQDLIITQNYNLKNRQLLFAANNAFVFGGMGSWNDLGFDTDEQQNLYDTLSADLYNAMNAAIVCSVNKDVFEK